MRLTCMGCGTDYDGDICPVCHKYDDSDYVIDDSKPPRVAALEKELADARAEIERLKEFIDQRDRKLLSCISKKCAKDALIKWIADLCHCAGLVNLSETETLRTIRRLTYRLWDKKTEKTDVLAALEAAERGK